MKVYLAGPIQGTTEKQSYGWRRDAQAEIEKAGHTVFSPSPVGFATPNGVYEEASPADCLEFVARDFLALCKSDVVLANLVGASKASIGTCFELAWAHMMDKPIYAALEAGEVHDHSFVHYVAIVEPTLAAILGTMMRCES